MMTLYEYNQLDDHQKFEALVNGSFLEVRWEDSLRVQLYSLDQFYVEVYYDPSINRIQKIIGFKSNRILAKYIKL